MRQEATEHVVDVAYLTKELKGKGKMLQCDHCKKPGHEEKECWHKGKSMLQVQKIGHLQKECKTKMEQTNMVKEVEETLL